MITRNIKTTEKKPQWQPPIIRPHQLGALNKFGRNHNLRQEFQDNIDGVSIKALLQKYGSPLFVTSESKLRSTIKNMRHAFEGRYPHIIHGWSYKTNYTSAICTIFHQEGSWAEVVSAFEYDKARHLGVPGNRIIYNGPHKTRVSLERAVNEGARIHIDHRDELAMLDDIASQSKKTVNVALRLNFDTGFTETWGRFGFNLESGEAKDAAYFVQKSKYLKLIGLHSHIGTFILDPRAYQAQIRILCQFMRELEQEGNTPLDYLDIGGGFASRNALQGIYLPPEQVVPDISQYAAAICETLLEETAYREQQGFARPTLVIESGRAMVDECQSLITSVVANKYLPDGSKAVILDAGVNVLFTGFWYDHKISLTQPYDGLAQDCVIYGPLCMNIDVVRRSIQLPPLQVGDPLLIHSVGAYNNTQWMQFIEYRPAVVLIHKEDKENKEGNAVSVIRNSENLASMIAHDKIPPHLIETGF